MSDKIAWQSALGVAIIIGGMVCLSPGLIVNIGASFGAAVIIMLGFAAYKGIRYWIDEKEAQRIETAKARENRQVQLLKDIERQSIANQRSALLLEREKGSHKKK